MRTVFEASTGVEAHMILNLLNHEGVDGRVEGEYLQGGVGDLQAINTVRVVVHDSDYEKARSIISEWESKQVDKPIVEDSKRKSSKIGIGFLGGLLVGIGSMYWAYNSPITSEGIDYNSDGKMDETWIYKDDRVSRGEFDRNMDGKIDFISKYDRKGMIYRAELDDNFDGVYESIQKFRFGNMYVRESDFNQDGKVDYRAYFKHGVLDEVEILDPETEIPRKKQKFMDQKISSAEYDTDGDGIFDVSYQYDYYEEASLVK